MSGGVCMMSKGVWIVFKGCLGSWDVLILNTFAKDYLRSDVAFSSNALMPSESYKCFCLVVSGWCLGVSGGDLVVSGGVWLVCKGVWGCINTKSICKRAYKVIYCFFFKYTYAL